MEVKEDQVMEYPMEDVQLARDELKTLLSTLFARLDGLEEADDDFELEPNKNIIENFNCKRQMRCEKCCSQFDNWEEIDQHNNTHHSHEIGNSQMCTICDITFDCWQERHNHMLTKHPVESGLTGKLTVISRETSNKAMWCCALCISQHFLDQEHWVKHHENFHSKYMGQKPYNWMWTLCDIKGRGIVNDKDALVHCSLCKVEFSYNPDVFNFDFHAKSDLHIRKVKEFITENNRLPMKFLKITNTAYEIAGLFHPHELQSSCCCRDFACDFCGLQKSMVCKFRDGSIVWCTVCDINVKWTNLEAGIEHVKSEKHQQKLCSHMMQHGFAPAFFLMFKKQEGQFIESVSFS